jgi:hypothetical protein
MRREVDWSTWIPIGWKWCGGVWNRASIHGGYSTMHSVAKSFAREGLQLEGLGRLSQ